MMRHQRGFTLVELIIYIGIFSIAAMLLIGVLTTFTKVQVRESATTAVSQEAQFVIQTIQRLVTDASLIELAKDSATSTLKLRMPVAADDPTCIQFSNGTVYLMQGNDGVNKQTCFATSTAQAKTLTTSKVVVNTLTFKKFENPPATDTVKIDLTLSYNSTNPQESAVSRTLQTAIAKVSAATFDSDIIPSADTQYDVGVGANRWRNGLFSNSLLVGYTSITGGVAAFNGNVGVGTSAPSYALDISGGFRVGNATTTNAIVFNPGTGNVGIGTNSPVTHLTPGLTVNGGTPGLALRESDAGVDAKIYDLHGDTNSLYGRLVNDAMNSATNWLVVERSGMTVTDVSFPNGNVGIGTAEPTRKVDIVSSVDSSNQTALAVDNIDFKIAASNPAGVNKGLYWHSAGATGGNTSYSYMYREQSTGKLFIGSQGAGTILETANGGYVGIGTTNPSTKLHVVGSGIEPAFITTSGNTGALSILSLYGSDGADREFYFNNGGTGAADGSFNGGGADYAEFFENLRTDVIPPATIVALEAGRVRVARRGDSFIAGVVSTSPGLVGNNGDTEEDRRNHPERWTLVALMGQVPVNVRGAIRHGDYIELDDNGVARRAAQWHPDVLGRTMESREAPDIGPIKVLIK